MDIKINEVGTNRRELVITVPKEDVDKAAAEIYRDIAKNVNIKGFRPGKAPKSVIKGFYGEYVTSELTKKLINDSLEKAVSENELPIVSMPDFDGEPTAAEGQDFSFSATFDLKPEVSPQQYTGFNLKKLKNEAGEADIDAVIEQLRSNYAEVKEIEDTGYEAVNGDYVSVNIECAEEPTLKRERMSVEVGGRSVFPGLETAIDGMKQGDSAEVSVTFPADHFMEQMQGRTVSVTVTAAGIRQKIKPELNDEFAKKVRPDVEDLAGLRQTISDDIRQRSENESRDSLERQVGDALLKANEFEVPDSMIDMQANMNLRNMAQRFSSQGMKIEDIFPDLDKLRDENRSNAEKVVRVALLVDAIAKELNLEVEEADIDKEIEEVAARYQVPAEMVKQNMLSAGGFEDMKFNLLERKVFDYVIENSDVEEVDKIEGDEANDSGSNGGGADE